MGVWRAYFRLAAMMVVAMPSLLACREEPCVGEQGFAVFLPPSGGEIGPTGRVESLTLCGGPVGSGTLPEYRVLASEIDGDLRIQSHNAKFVFPNLIAVRGVISGHLLDLSFDILTYAQDIVVSGDDSFALEALSLERVGRLDVRNMTLIAPSMTTASTLALSGGVIDIESLTTVDSLFASSEAAVDLPNLRSAGELTFSQVSVQPSLAKLEDAGPIYVGDTAWTTLYLPELRETRSMSVDSNALLEQIQAPKLVGLGQLVATGNSKLRTCELEVLAVQAGVPAGAVTLSGNSSAPCE